LPNSIFGQLQAGSLAALLALASLSPLAAQAANDGSIHHWQSHAGQSHAGQSHPGQSQDGRSDDRTFAQVGLASWYGHEKEGQRTASGEHFNPGRLTAAHRTLPLGTVVRVTNLSTGKVVKVRVNDRGPYVRRRIVDLSAAAGRTLDIRRNGVALVRIEVFPSDQTQNSGSLADTE